MRLRSTPAEKRRSAQLKALPPLAIEFSTLMAQVSSDSGSALAPEESRALRERAATLATLILDDLEQLRWDPGVSPQMRQMLDATRRKMLADTRVKGLLKDYPAAPG